MGRLFPLLVLSQISTMAPLFGFVLYSDTGAFANFIFMLLLGQLLWPLLTLRLDIQIQVELQHSRQAYVLALGLWVFGALSLLSAFGLWIGQIPIFTEGEMHKIWGGLFIGASLAAQGLIRGYVVARGKMGPIVFFELSNILKNFGALAVSGWVVAQFSNAALADLFVWANIIHGITIVAITLVALRAQPRIRVLQHFLRKGSILRRRAHKVLYYSFPNSFIGMATGRLPLLAIEAALPAPLSAAFLAANRISLSPLSFLIYALRILGVIEMNKRRNNTPDQFRRFLWTVTIGAPLVLSPMILPAFYPSIFDPIMRFFNESWTEAVAYLPMMYLWAALFLMTGWLDRVFDVTGRQHIILMIELVMLVLTAILSAAIWQGVLTGQVALWSVVGMGMLHSIAWGWAFLTKEYRHV
ncbi:hypothetical protein [Cochlodiniinecator piscidefendens]|uniref:hypothetical protein n=1 Tax=Cochlodiniinecator piscidefendens TaxID=2715756 RepID=UPI0014083446|nr:hypothetical protein [Cochlodiniinecator piscidefendens]